MILKVDRYILKNSFLEFSIHFLYLVVFYLIATYFNGYDYLTGIVKAYLSDDIAKNIVITLIVTFAFIGCVFCLSILTVKTIDRDDIKYTSIIFKFGIDFLYFIFISLGTLSCIAFAVALIENTFSTPSLTLCMICFFVCMILRVLINTFDNAHLKSL